MTPIERLQAAIRQLERLRGNALNGRWVARPDAFYGSALESKFGSVVEVGDIATDDALLIAVLHRTIDAQLAILKVAAECDRPWKLSEPGYYDAEMALADAILGRDV
jgi:hypothetical protein